MSIDLCYSTGLFDDGGRVGNEKGAVRSETVTTPHAGADPSTPGLVNGRGMYSGYGPFSSARAYPLPHKLPIGKPNTTCVTCERSLISSTQYIRLIVNYTVILK
jgi:hypothetical protein